MNTCTLTLVTIFLFPVFSNTAHSAENDSVTFNSEFLRSAIDTSEYSQGNPVAPGMYDVELYVNERLKGRAEVNFEKLDDNSSISRPCFDLNSVSMLGIDIERLDQKIIEKLKDKKTCNDLSKLVSGVDVNYDVSTQQINISAPQLVLTRYARGYVTPELWDNGVTAATLQYDYNAYSSDMSGAQNITTQYLALRGGVNWDAWRLRYRGALNWNNSNNWNYDNTSTFLERAIIPFRSKMVLGESTTDGQVFDSVGFSGLMLASDDRMYIDSQRGYAPIISGVANSNSLVQVMQRGTRIYETTVPPGPFVIDDLYPTGAGGDLLVTIREADGSERSFTVNYASIAQLLRPGTTRYTLMSGRYRNPTVNENPLIAMGTLRHGFTNLITGYGGVLGGENYQSYSSGIALNTDVGALSADITHARTVLQNSENKNGNSFSLSFSKILPATDTNITLANYRYSNSGYYSIDDAMFMRDIKNHPDNYYSDSISRKNRIQLSVSQSLSDVLGNINLNASTQDYWNKNGRDTEYQLGYANSFGKFNLNVNLNRTRDLTNGHWDNKIAIGISFPFGDSAKSMYINSTYVHDKGHNGLQNTVAGTLGDKRQYNYNAFASVDRYEQTGTKNTGGASGTWNSPYTNLGGSYSAGSGYQQYGMNMSGGVIGYSEGIVFTPTMGDTIAIVEANYAGGASITNNSSMSLDRSGKAAVPYLTPYRQNTIELDPKGLSNDVSLAVTSQNSVPTAGAVVLLKYKTDKGYSALLTIHHNDSAEIPFSASILDEKGNVVGYMAQAGQSFVRVKNKTGKLIVKWGASRSQQCSLNYHLQDTPHADDGDLRRADAVCQ